MTALNQQFFSDLAKTGQEKTLDFLHEIAAKKDFSSLKEFMVFSKEGNKNLPDLYNPDKNFGRNFFTALAAPLKQDECAGISFKKFTGEIINIKRWSLSQDQKDHIHGFLDWACHDADALLVVSRILIAKIKSFPIAREIDNAWESSDFDMPSDKLEGNFRPFLDDEQLLSLIESLSEESIKKASRKWNKNITQLLEKRKKIELKKGKLFNNFPEFKKPLIENQYSNIDLIEDFLNFTTPDQMLFIILKMENIKKNSSLILITHTIESSMYCSEINDLNGPVIYSRFKYFYKEGIFLQLMKKSYNSLSKRVFQIMDGKYEHDEDVNFNDEFSGDEDEGTAQ